MPAKNPLQRQGQSHLVTTEPHQSTQATKTGTVSQPGQNARAGKLFRPQEVLVHLLEQRGARQEGNLQSPDPNLAGSESKFSGIF